MIIIIEIHPQMIMQIPGTVEEAVLAMVEYAPERETYFYAKVVIEL